MKIASKEYALKMIPLDVMQIIQRAIQDAIIKGAGLRTQYPNINKRTVSSFINDCMCQNIENLIGTLGYITGKVHLYRKYQTLRMSIDNGAVVLRFKKMKISGVTSNIPTQAALAFESAQLNLFDETPTVHINAGYAMVNHGTEYRIMLSHPTEFGKVDWIHDITEIEEHKVISINPHHLETSITSTTSRKPRIKKEVKRNGIQHNQS